MTEKEFDELRRFVFRLSEAQREYEIRFEALLHLVNGQTIRLRSDDVERLKSYFEELAVSCPGASANASFGERTAGAPAQA